MDSAKDLILESGQSAQRADGKNSNLGASVGVGVSVGAQTGVYAYGEVGGSKGKNRYLAQTHDHTTLKAGNIQLASEGDTTLKGASATANRIDADVKGRLNIESVQDHIEQENKQSGAGVRVQVSFGTAWEASASRSLHQYPIQGIAYVPSGTHVLRVPQGRLKKILTSFFRRPKQILQRSRP